MRSSTTSSPTLMWSTWNFGAQIIDQFWPTFNRALESLTWAFVLKKGSKNHTYRSGSLGVGLTMVQQVGENLPTNTARLIEDLKDQINRAQAGDDTSMEEIEDFMRRLYSTFWEEKQFWRQKTRAIWLGEGDKNTKIFHATIKQRQVRNHILCLKDRHGNWTESAAETLKGLQLNIFKSFSPPHIQKTRRTTSV